MHIQRQTSMELVLQDGSMWMAFLFVPAGIAIAVSSIEKHKPFELLVTALFLLLAAAFTRHTTFTLDGMQRVARWRRRTFLKVETGSIPFDTIKDIVIDAQTGGRNNTMSYRLSINTASGSVPMANIFQGGALEHYQKLRQQVLEFVGLAAPAADANDLVSSGSTGAIPADLESSLRTLISKGRIIDAVSLLRMRQNLSLVEAKTRVDALVEQMKNIPDFRSN